VENQKKFHTLKNIFPISMEDIIKNCEFNLLEFKNQVQHYYSFQLKTLCTTSSRVLNKHKVGVKVNL
jgi:hypothetical protein